jgi:hypothetical protein
MASHKRRFIYWWEYMVKRDITMVSKRQYDCVRTTVRWCQNDETMVLEWQCIGGARQYKNNITMVTTPHYDLGAQQYDIKNTTTRLWQYNSDSELVTGR